MAQIISETIESLKISKSGSGNTATVSNNMTDLYLAGQTNITSLHVGRGVSQFSIQNCSNLKTLTGGNDVTSLPNSAFWGSGVANVTLANCEVINSNSLAFSNLVEARFPNLVRMAGGWNCQHANSLEVFKSPKLKRIEAISAFSPCPKLKRIYFPEIEYLFNGACASCGSLERVILGNRSTSLTIGGGSEFTGCSSLTELYILTNFVPTLNSTSAFITNTPIANGNGWIYVRSSQYDNFRNHSVWGQFANMISYKSDDEYQQMIDAEDADI